MRGLLKASAATRTVNPAKPAVPVGHGDTTFYSKLHSDICVQALVCEDACTSVAINRRGRKDGELCIFPNNEGIVDFKVRVVEIRAAGGGRPSVIAAEYAAHPVVVAASGLGGEYPSFMRKFLEKRYAGVTAMFFQGCSGNIRARLLDRERAGWIKGTPEIAERFGYDLGEAVERALAKEGDPIAGPVEFEYREVAAPLKRETEPKTWPLRIQAFRLGAGSRTPFTLVGIGAESFIEYGLELERRLKPANSIVIGCANGCEGYLPTARALKEGGFEPNAWGERCYGIPGPYAPGVEYIALEAATGLARPKH